MSRKAKVITIEGRGEITVKEVSPWAVWTIFSGKGKKADGGEFAALLSDCIDKPWDEVKTWYASEQKQIIDAFLEVNDSFLEIAGKLGIKAPLQEMLTGIVKDLPAVFAASYRQVTAPAAGTTAGVSS
jgi:hypothetical protein